MKDEVDLEGLLFIYKYPEYVSSFDINPVISQAKAEYLKDRTGISFRVDGYELKATSFNLKLNAFDSIESLKNQVDSFLKSNNADDIALKQRFNYLSDYMSWNGTEIKWYGNFGKSSIFDMLYYAVTGKYFDDMAWANDIYSKSGLNTLSNTSGTVVIEELHNIEVTFYKNGKIRIKGLLNKEYERINHLFSLLDTHYHY